MSNYLIKIMFMQAVKAVEKKHGKIDRMVIEYNGNDSQTIIFFSDGSKKAIINGHKDKEGANYKEMICSGLGISVLQSLKMNVVPEPFSCRITGSGFDGEGLAVNIDTEL